jgi:hypothetical protein
MKQTAIQEYIESMYEIIKISKAEELTPCTLKAILYCIEKAKGKLNMEKEQIERAYHQGVVNELSIYCTPDPSTYYKKTYGDE